MITRTLALALVSSLALAQAAMRVEPGQVAAARAPGRGQTQVTLEEISTDMARMQAGLAQAGSALAEGAALYQQYDQQLDSYLRLAAEAARGDPATRQHLADATRKMQETRMSFNLQYLQLQSQMQHENRQYTMISNVMKTKHDTVRNSIGNIR